MNIECINDILNDDALYLVFAIVNDPRDWKNLGRVCKLWRSVSNSLKERKAKQFSKFELTNYSVVVSSGYNRLWHERSRSKSYFYLPNKRLHGTHRTVTRVLKCVTREVLEETITIKKFKWGSQVSEETTETIKSPY
jgi:hypothetical protein